MTEQIMQALKDEQISEPEIINLICTYRKMVRIGILKEKNFKKLLIKLGVDRPTENKFILADHAVYTLS
jgi:hypothetical protein